MPASDRVSARLFSYGTLQLESVQRATFGRVLQGRKDELAGCERVMITVADEDVIAATGRAEHANLAFNGRSESRVTGTLLDVTDDEIAKADLYEGLAKYERRQVTLASGENAWVYVYGPTFALFTCTGGVVKLPDEKLVFVDRRDGGHLIVNPPRAVWERSELTVEELSRWSALVAATGRAMLDVLPQLEGGCVNYFEAGNWALHDEAVPRGRKSARDHRNVHLHLFGRSPAAVDPSWKWGEAPRFPEFRERHAWAESRELLTQSECGQIVARIADLLRDRYGVLP